MKTTMWAPLVVICLVNPINYISIINHCYYSYKPSELSTPQLQVISIINQSSFDIIVLYNILVLQYGLGCIHFSSIQGLPSSSSGMPPSGRSSEKKLPAKRPASASKAGKPKCGKARFGKERFCWKAAQKKIDQCFTSNLSLILML